MKYNEAVRPNGIGRKQLAFNTVTTPNELTVIETELNEQVVQSDNLDNAISMDGFAEVGAYSSATATQTDVQNICIEMESILDFSFTGAAAIQFGKYCVTNPFIDYDTRSQQFYCRKPGWYAVKIFLHTTAVNGNYDWWVYLNTNKQVNAYDEEYYPQYIDYNNAYKHCSLNGLTLYNSPVQQDGNYNSNVRPFQLVLGTTYTGVSTLTTTNTKCSLQIIYLGELDSSQRVTKIIGS